MDLRQYLRSLRKGWWIIAIAAVVGLSGGALINLRATPQYASTVTFFISTPTAGGTTALAADQFATRRITSYLGLLSSDVVAKRVIGETGIDLSLADVKSEIKGDADLNTVLLTATVTDASSDRSLAIAQALATSFGSVVNQVDPIGPDNVVLRVVSGPTLNPVPVSPRTSVNLAAGLVAGLLLGVGIAVLRQVLDTTIHQPQDLRALAESPVLGVIPFEKSAKKAPMITDGQARSLRAEALRQLRTNLQFIDVERPVRVLVVTSSVAGEGKSMTAANLAVSFAESNRRVLLIEADLRRPRVADYLGLERAVGLTNVLAGQVAIEEVLQPWGRGQLEVLPSGSIPPNPSELLGSPKMLQLLERLKTRFEIIVIDTPPLLPVTDGAVAAAYADGAVLVVRYGSTKRGQITTAVRSLKSVDARLLGTVLNMTPPKSADGYGSYGYGYYNKVSPGSEAPGNGSWDQLAATPDPTSENGALRTGTHALGEGKGSSAGGSRRPRRAIRLKPAHRDIT